MASLKLEEKQVEKIQETIAELEDSASSLKDYTWLLQVLSYFVLIRMAQALSCSCFCQTCDVHPHFEQVSVAQATQQKLH